MTPSEYLELVTIRTGSAAFHLGCVNVQRVTIYSQQTRALNLAWAAHQTGMVRGNTRVVVVGGGAGGLTAALGFRRLGATVTVLEREEVLLPRFSGCTDRYLHPHAYDWPALGSQELKAGLPLMDWTAAPASAVAKQLRRAWTVETAGIGMVDVRASTRVVRADLDQRVLHVVAAGNSYEVPYDLLTPVLASVDPRT